MDTLKKLYKFGIGSFSNLTMAYRRTGDWLENKLEVKIIIAKIQ